MQSEELWFATAPRRPRERGTPNPWRLLQQPLRKLLDAIQSLLDIRQARGVAEADVVVRAERDAGDGGDFFLLQQLRAKFGGFQAGAGDVREEVKRAFGVDAGDAGDAVELLPGKHAALGIFRQPDWQVVLWANEVGLLVLWL
jgi:hypothetical protein